MRTKILLAGFGTMGKFYAEKLACNADVWNIEIAGIVDTAPESFNLGVKSGVNDEALLGRILNTVPRFSDIDDALHQTNPDVIINATNSESHIKIIRALERYPAVKGFLTEKPLVNTSGEEDEAVKRLSSFFVSMNMITNFSAAALELKEWVRDNPQMKLIGLEGVWGKDRRADKRPTPGIASDIVHPVGLIQSIFNTGSWNLKEAKGLYGHLSTDRSNNALNCVYQYDISFVTDVAPVRMNCSFAWAAQSRCIRGFFEKPEGGYVIAELFLDERQGGGAAGRGDFIRIYDVLADVRNVALAYESPQAVDDKLSVYLERSLRVLRGEIPVADGGLVGLAEEKAIGHVYGLLAPAADRDELLKNTHLQIMEIHPDNAPKEPRFLSVAQSSVDDLKSRIVAFKNVSSAIPAPSQPVPSP